MKTFKEYSIGQYRPIADIGNMKSPEPRPKYALNATAKGPGLGTMNPMMMLAKKILRLKKVEDNKRILRISFENLIKNYDETLDEIKIFLNLESENHHKFSLFEPSPSKIGTLKHFKYPEIFDDYLTELEEYEQST